MFLVVLAVSDPLLLSVAALSTEAHSLRVYLSGGISVGEQATCPSNMKQKKRKADETQTNFIPLFVSFSSIIYLAFFAFSALLDCFFSFIVCRYDGYDSHRADQYRTVRGYIPRVIPLQHFHQIMNQTYFNIALLGVSGDLVSLL